MRTSYSVIPSETPHPLCPGHSLFYTSRLWGWLFHYHKLSFTTRLSISLFCSVSASLYLPSNRKQDPPVPPKKKREKRKKESKPSALLTFLFICFNCLMKAKQNRNRSIPIPLPTLFPPKPNRKRHMQSWLFGCKIIKFHSPFKIKPTSDQPQHSMS